MRAYALLILATLALSLALFAIVQLLGVPLLVDPQPVLGTGGPAAAALGVGLLVADVLLPVPSGLVMVAHGALFGAPLGTLLSVVGGVGAAAAACALGRGGGRVLERVVPAADRARAEALLQRWGAVAIVVTRPVPLLAEATAVLAGTARLGWARVLLAAAAGSLPPALLHALTGATAASLGDGMLVFGLVLLIAGGFWLLARRIAG